MHKVTLILVVILVLVGFGKSSHYGERNIII